MTILVLGQFIPWPPTGGGRMRLANVVQALREVDDVDLAAFTARPHDEEASHGQAERVLALPRPRVRGGPLNRAAWLTGSRAPFELAAADYGPARRDLAGWLGSYDLVWFSRAETYHAFRALVPGLPAIVDLDDLEGRKLRHGSRLGLTKHGDRRLDGLSRSLIDRRNAARWDGLQRRIAQGQALAVVCSEEDRRYLGGGRIEMVPNGYESPDAPAGRPEEVGEPPTVLFQGMLRYGPNADAARYLATEIAPLLRERVPGVRIRLVGTTDRRTMELHDPPRVTVTGWVPSIEEELAGADVVAVPIRFAGGTRIKILEAFAHRIPVVATRIGAEGLGTVPGRHLLEADDPIGFAEATALLLRDGALRLSLTDEARRLFEERFRWERSRELIRSLARRMAGTPDVSHIEARKERR